jgi:hypothetical protein
MVMGFISKKGRKSIATFDLARRIDECGISAQAGDFSRQPR